MLPWFGMLVVLSSISSARSALTFSLVGEGNCKDSNDQSYDFLTFGSSGQNLTDCFTQCGQDISGVSQAPVGFTFVNSSGICLCLFPNGVVETLSLPTDTTPSYSSKSFGNSGQGRIVSSDNTSDRNCYMVAKCPARVLFVPDRTYSKDVVNNVQTSTDIMSSIVDEVTFGSDTTFGILLMLQHRVKWMVELSSPAATDATQLKAELSTLTRGWKNRATNFWPIFSGGADSISNPSIPSYIVIFSDGVLRRNRNWRRLFKLKNKMKRRLGSSMPTVLCYRIGRSSSTRFFRAVCDETYYEGMDGKTNPEIVEDIANTICSD